ncbi:serine protease AprX [Motilibacter rhizosphaerae]|uniref:Serine protease AprX n=1 Tax=Motilibacter rhizosphaerae TaxID=598652 RepID=A0A4Q7NVA8_9ACTN|nr:S8 family serine peptidase [Motilibacter rhizosphaerae]RZS91054.1 serine protease AprX [Motilibacter rhizosphaerae]
MLAAVAAAAGGATAAPAHASTPVSAPSGTEDVIVSGQPGALSQVEAAVRAAHGTVRSTLPVIAGVSARVPAAAVAQLRQAPGVRAVTEDAHGHLMAVDPTLGYDVQKDPGSLFLAAQVVHANTVWGKGVTGKGVDVALIDSGVAPVQGLTSGNVVVGPDLSFESQSPALVGKDTFGHGTHMGSIIVGRDAAATGSVYAKADSHQFVGIAPDARLVSIKVAASDGAADVSQVIAAIGWVAQHAHTDGFNIKVLNLSYGTNSAQDPSVDPLDYAVEQAWKAGVTVVVSGGNDGTTHPALADPANDPMVVAVGADDPNGDPAVGNDTIPDFSQHGTALRSVDVVAPGVHVLGLRLPNGSIDQDNPGARVGSRFFRGSGTSQAAAVVSGIAALYASKYPTATPDQIKDALKKNADSPTYTKKLFTGLGVPNADKMLGYKPNPLAVQAGVASGLGSLDAARGGSYVTDGVSTLTGEVDIFGRPWNPGAWALATGTGTAWSGGSWLGTTFTGGALGADGNWTQAAWTATDWNSRSWRDSGWDSRSWRDSGWDSRSWRDSDWTSLSWRSAGWDSVSWRTGGWSDASWADASWS